jgi:hypothetical protein
MIARVPGRYRCLRWPGIGAAAAAAPPPPPAGRAAARAAPPVLASVCLVRAISARWPRLANAPADRRRLPTPPPRRKSWCDQADWPALVEMPLTTPIIRPGLRIVDDPSRPLRALFASHLACALRVRAALSVDLSSGAVHRGAGCARGLRGRRQHVSPSTPPRRLPPQSISTRPPDDLRLQRGLLSAREVPKRKQKELNENRFL